MASARLVCHCVRYHIEQYRLYFLIPMDMFGSYNFTNICPRDGLSYFDWGGGGGGCFLALSHRTACKSCSFALWLVLGVSKDKSVSSNHHSEFQYSWGGGGVQKPFFWWGVLNTSGGGTKNFCV